MTKFFTFVLIVLSIGACRQHECDVPPPVFEIHGQEGAELNPVPTSTPGPPPKVELNETEEFLNAALAGDLNKVKAILAKTADSPVNLLRETNDDGQTALFLAVKGGHIEVIKYLIERDPELKDLADKNGMTPLAYAESTVIANDETLTKEILALLKGEEIDPEVLNQKLIALIDKTVEEEELESLFTAVGEALAEGASPDSIDSSAEGLPVPAIFLAMGFRPNENRYVIDSKVSTGYGPRLAKILKDAGASMTSTLTWKFTWQETEYEQELTPAEAIDFAGFQIGSGRPRGGTNRYFNRSRDQWLEVFSR